MRISQAILKRFQTLLGPQHVLTDDISLALNGYDCSPSQHRPDAVLNIHSAHLLEKILPILSQEKIPFIARAAATNHAGSCCAVRGGVVLNLAPLNTIHHIDTQQNLADVDPCVITGDLQKELSPLGFFYAPDPASEKISTLSGNLAQNASGARCMKYGNTADHVAQVDFLLPTGEKRILSSSDAGPDWIGLLAGSEGTLGLIERMKVRFLPTPKYIKTFLTTFSSLENAVQTVSDLVAHGLIPRCVEAMDQMTIAAVENFSHAGYPTQAQALLIIELDGNLKQIKQDSCLLEKLCQKNNCQTFTTAKTEAEREKLWKGRRAAYAAMTSLAPNIAVGDGTVPRSLLPQALLKVRQIIAENAVKASLLFHAGDGNFHPQIVFDARNKEQTRQVKKSLQEILKTCVDFGGTVSGEHGIGVEKRAVMAYQYDKNTLQLFQKIKKAFDPFNLANPEKIIPIDYAEKAREYQEEDPCVNTLQQKILSRFKQQEKTVIEGSLSALKSHKNCGLSSLSLNRILEIDKLNYTATVQAGIKIKDLLQKLSEENVFAKIPSQYQGTLGGLVACKAYPLFTNQILGLQVILPNGNIINYGGKIMKNAAGYNLCRLFSGSVGALGLITKLTFKIYATAQPEEKMPVFSFSPADNLFQRIKKEMDPSSLFLSSAFEEEK